jgi:hypothetical protein
MIHRFCALGTWQLVFSVLVSSYFFVWKKNISSLSTDTDTDTDTTPELFGVGIPTLTPTPQLTVSKKEGCEV